MMGTFWITAEDVKFLRAIHIAVDEADLLCPTTEAEALRRKIAEEVDPGSISRERLEEFAARLSVINAITARQKDARSKRRAKK